MLQLWFAKVLRDGLALAASGAFAPFKDVGAYHLRSMLRAAGTSGDQEEAVQTVLEGFNDATCMPDVGPAFKKMHEAGIKVKFCDIISLPARVCIKSCHDGKQQCLSPIWHPNMGIDSMQVSTMTNGSVAITQGLLERAQLQQYVTEMMDITQPQAWKPSPQAYHFAVQKLHLQPQQVATDAVVSQNYITVQLVLPMHVVNVQSQQLSAHETVINLLPVPPLKMTSFDCLCRYCL